MPVTAPTSSAMVTTRIARLRLIFQLVIRFGRKEGKISMMKDCGAVSRNERIMRRSSSGTPRIASSASTRKTGPQTATSIKAMRNSAPRNHNTANRIQDTTGTAISRRIIGNAYLSSLSDLYIKVARRTPSTNERISAPTTRARVTPTSRGVMVRRLCPMRNKPGIANAGMPKAGAEYDSSSQTMAKRRSETRVSRENVPPRGAARYSSWGIDDLVVRQLLIEARLHRALHHVPDRLAHRRLPGRLDDHVEPLGLDCRLEDAGRQLDRIGGDLVGGIGLVQYHVCHIFERRLHAVGFQLCACDREIRVHDGDVLAKLDALRIGVHLDHLKLRPAHVSGELLALEVGERLDVGVLREDQQIGKGEGSAEDAQRHALLIELLQNGRSADQRVGLAGGERGVECRDRGIRLCLKLEAVLGVEAARLHDVPNERIEYRQRQA